MSKWRLLMTAITLHHLCFGHFVNSSVIVLDLGILYLSPKQSPPISHNDLKKDGVQLLLSNYSSISVYILAKH